MGGSRDKRRGWGESEYQIYFGQGVLRCSRKSLRWMVDRFGVLIQVFQDLRMLLFFLSLIFWFFNGNIDVFFIGFIFVGIKFQVLLRQERSRLGIQIGMWRRWDEGQVVVFFIFIFIELFTFKYQFFVCKKGIGIYLLIFVWGFEIVGGNQEQRVWDIVELLCGYDLWMFLIITIIVMKVWLGWILCCEYFSGFALSLIQFKFYFVRYFIVWRRIFFLVRFLQGRELENLGIDVVLFEVSFF